MLSFYAAVYLVVSFRSNEGPPPFSDRQPTEHRCSVGCLCCARQGLILTSSLLQCYLHSRLRWPFSDVFRLVVQGVIMAVAWWTTLSRISDNAHHPEDVIAGALIGTVTALLVVGI